MRASGRLHRRCRAEAEPDRGSVLVLGLGLVVLALLLAGVVVDASRAFLDRRALSALADGAALQGAHAVDLAALYASAPASSLPLSGGAARLAAAYVLAHARDAGVLSARLVDVTVQGPTVRVTVSMIEPAALTSALMGEADPVTVTVTAAASSDVVP